MQLLRGGCAANTAYGLYKIKPKLDMERLKQIRNKMDYIVITRIINIVITLKNWFYSGLLKQSENLFKILDRYYFNFYMIERRYDKKWKQMR